MRQPTRWQWFKAWLWRFLETVRAYTADEEPRL